MLAQVSVFDANTVTKDRLIGLYEFDFSDMYYRDGHELWRQWVALVDPLDKKDKGIQGYLKLSVAVLGPSDTLVMHSSKEAEEKDAADEQAQSDDKGKSAIGSLLSGSTGGNSMDSICLLPPSIKRELHFLVLSVFRAEGLPKMDREILGGVISRAGIDAYVAVTVRAVMIV